MPGNAPVERVGGRQDNGPWPPDADEIAEGNQYSRQVRLGNGVKKELPVEVHTVRELTDETGDPTGGRVVSFTFDDPTVDGGGT